MSLRPTQTSLRSMRHSTARGRRLRLAAMGLLATAVLSLAGCATVGVSSSATPSQAAALALLDQGNARDAAPRLEAEAQLATGTQRNALLADAAFAWHDAGDDAKARGLLAQVDGRRLAGATRARYELAANELGLAPAVPLDSDARAIPSNLVGRYSLARAVQLEAAGDAFGAAEARARADAGLVGKPHSDNQQAIERALAKLDGAALSAKAAALPAGDPLYNFAGRALLRRGLPLPRPFDRGEQWKLADSSRPPAERDGYRPPLKLAVLLPLSGSLSTAAAPVRDGLLAGYYGENRRKPQLTFYDTAGSAGGATAAYAKASAEGADFVVGPLGRDEVSALFGAPALAVPVLALNRGTVPPPAGNAGFSLAPEDDGIAAAEYLLGRQKANVVVVGSNDDNGRRAVAAFADRFRERGGKVAVSISVAETPGDVSGQLRTAASAGADAVFLAVRGNTARTLVPQLALAGLGGMPRVATSQLVVNTGKPEQDAALDGVAYPSEAWTARGVNGLPPASMAADTLPSARGQGARLFAFGYDAWLISAYLEKLANGPDGELRGATGTLHLDGFGNILRTPSWATFSGGRSQPLNGGGG